MNLSLTAQKEQTNLKTVADWRQHYDEHSDEIAATLRLIGITGPAQFAQSGEEVAHLEDDPSNIRVRSRIPLLLNTRSH